jgi:hypothetical protein
MELLDPRLALLVAGAAVVRSGRVRKLVGQGFGYAAAGAMKVGTPVVDAGRDIVQEARHVASPDGSAKKGAARTKSAAAA